MLLVISDQAVIPDSKEWPKAERQGQCQRAVAMVRGGSRCTEEQYHTVLSMWSELP